ncbi:sulfotransferase domain-containing protein [Actinoplanes sp. NPDC049118]|uniref:sulfotransferase domain-containing protein n=1 Tax=Actinoplanes sp. NPDC049118 TaxID=3155769 RepID=UPI00340DAA7C
MMNRAVRFAKHHTPNSVRVVARRAMCEAHNARLRLTVPVQSRCEYQNIYHCTMRKTASQWIKALFNDPAVYRYSGLLPYDPRPYRWHPPLAFPPGRAVVSLFVSHQGFMSIPKPDRYQAFFVLRDPRDMVVSSYFSYRSSHTPMGDVPQVRRAIQDSSPKDGLLHVIGHLSRKGTFRSLRAWATAPSAEAVRFFRYEDLTGEHQADELDRLLRHCGILLPPADLAALQSRYSFARMRGGRGSATTVSHYRKGEPGDWRNHFDDDVYAAFTAAAGDLVELLGYPARDQPPGREPES